MEIRLDLNIFMQPYTSRESEHHLASARFCRLSKFQIHLSHFLQRYDVRYALQAQHAPIYIAHANRNESFSIPK